MAYDQFVIRFPDGLRDRIKQAARANNRSMNQEIVARLSHSLDSGAEALPLGNDSGPGASIAPDNLQELLEEAAERAARKVLLMQLRANDEQ
ncbi:Arc family DNA-binding protein [Magnetofaba australis]|uniref:Putative Arc-like DNA binding protein n=1 Tax=Magnetofaba australis IT-1 TaxID=1434232 RepID=A0A1Y2K4T9_9PROT|nr:Arc family DNA-binding protein [Magnetofaba australis]OSM02134.1 putative Arc-like DNA binding protein [Magnetofaba australis IT-1]